MATEKAKNVPPFVRFCAASVPMVFDDSLSYYECLCALTNFIQKNLVEVVNYNATQLDGLLENFEKLKQYVDNYFDNLDVQEEINNKLDDMAEHGELTAIIAAFAELNPLFVYDTLDDLIAADNLIAGNTARTLGKETLNDGYGAYYAIDETGDIALDNGLYATIKDNTGDNNYYDEITVTNGRANNADYYIASVPLNDNNGDLIPCYVNEDSTETTTPLTYAGGAVTTVTINAGMGRLNSENVYKQGVVVANGVVVHEDLCDIPAPERYSYLGIKGDRTVANYPSYTTGAEMVADGVENAFLTFGQIVTNGVITIDEYYDQTKVEPWVAMGVKLDGTFVIMASDGRSDRNKGMTYLEMASFMLGLGCVNAWRVDGGGSSSLVYKGSKQNRNIDQNGTVDRAIYVTLNFKKETVNKQLGNVYAFIGKERQLLNQQLRYDISSSYEPKRAHSNFWATRLGFNVISTADTWTSLEVEDSYSHGRAGVWDLIRNESEKTIGVKFLKTGLYRIQLSVLIQTTSASGERGLRIDSPLGTAVNTHASCTSMYNPAAAGGFEKNLFTTVNVTEPNTEIYFCGRGQVGDDFNRINAFVDEIGAIN